jgi:hypothetical protein
MTTRGHFRGRYLEKFNGKLGVEPAVLNKSPGEEER